MQIINHIKHLIETFFYELFVYHLNYLSLFHCFDCTIEHMYEHCIVVYQQTFVFVLVEFIDSFCLMPCIGIPTVATTRTIETLIDTIEIDHILSTFDGFVFGICLECDIETDTFIGIKIKTTTAIILDEQEKHFKRPPRLGKTIWQAGLNL
nr:MAG TPA: hypothetical protein [Caudoviricetes sp.]